MNACLSVWGVIVLPVPARRAVLRMTRPAPCRSSRRPSGGQEHRPAVRSATARSIARAVRGASGMVTALPPLRVIVSVRCPRSRPRCSMSALVAPETRSPFSAGSRDQLMLGRRPEPGSHQQGAELVAVQRGGVRLIIHPRAADMRGG